MNQKKDDKKKHLETPTLEEKPSEIDLVKNELLQMTELAKRTMADLQNFRRRQEEERINIIRLANEELIKRLLPALENLNKAISLIPKESTTFKEGLEMSVKQINKAFEDMGLIQIEALNKPFNPNLHEALTQGPGEKDMVVEELGKGYVLGDKVILHSKVKVGNGEK
jgi:molecular chaperone GrpE